MTTSPDVESLVERAEWIRALARALVRDEHEAEDLAQDAWVIALEHPAGAGGSRGWLATLLRNLARSRWRTARRRDARERESARPERQPPSSELVDQLDAHEALVRAVRELAEPYREAILLRYFEGLAPREISARTGLPVKTVDTRLYRALALLRSQLDEGHRGDRHAWFALLVPLVRPRDAALAGALVVQTKVKVVLAAAAALAFLVWTVRRGASDASSALVAPAPQVSDVTGPVADAESQSIERAELRGSESSPVSAESSAPAARRETQPFRGKVVDTHGIAVADLRVVLVNEDSGELIPGADAFSDATGEFEIEAPRTALDVAIVSERWTMVLDPDGTPGGVIVVAPRRALAGRVVDEGGEPIERAQIELLLPSSLRATLPLAVDMCRDVHWLASADANGAFELAEAPDLEGCALNASYAGFAPSRTELESGDRLDLRLVLRRHAEGARLIGRVLGPRGEPIEGAHVAFEDPGPVERAPFRSVATNARGEFDLPLDSIRADIRKLRAVKAGFAPAEVACSSEKPSERASWPSPLELVLGGAPLTISGVVLDLEGRPVAGARVSNLDSTRFGEVEVDFNGTPLLMSEDLETLLAGAQYTTATYSDDVGRFEMRGLLPKRYRLCAFDERTMALAVTAPIEAGRRDVEIRWTREECFERIAGRVRGSNGEPLPGIEVSLLRRGPIPTGLSARGEDAVTAGFATQTDAEGRFEFVGAPRAVHGLKARFSGRPIEDEVKLADFANVEDVTIVLVRSCHMKIDLTGSGLRARSFSVLDANGKPLMMTLFRGTVGAAGYAFGMQDLGTEALMVPETAAVLVLNLENGETARVPLHLVPGELTTVRP